MFALYDFFLKVPIFGTLTLTNVLDVRSLKASLLSIMSVKFENLTGISVHSEFFI